MVVPVGTVKDREATMALEGATRGVEEAIMVVVAITVAVVATTAVEATKTETKDPEVGMAGDFMAGGEPFLSCLVLLIL